MSVSRGKARATPFGLAIIAFLSTLAVSCEKRSVDLSVETPGPDDSVKAPAVDSGKIKLATHAVEATEKNIAAAKEQRSEAASKARKQWIGRSFEEYEKSVFKEPAENGKYLVSGDYALSDRKHLLEFFEEMQGKETGAKRRRVDLNMLPALTVDTVDNNPNLWSSARKRNLSYCISTAFNSNYRPVVAAMEAATSAWEETADVDFIHVSSQDGKCTAKNQEVVFDVRPIDIDGEYLARAFFPNDSRDARNILIDSSVFELDPDGKLQLTGVLRHELGHALGFRHEHTRPEAGPCFEDDEYKPITSYDAFSVMHYPNCNGGGDWSLSMTDRDKLGVACAYGKNKNRKIEVAGFRECKFKPEKPLAIGVEVTTFEKGQKISAREKKHYGPFSVKRGSLVDVRMTSATGNTGDPDLYIRYLGQPDLTRWDCRPFLSHANENCEMVVPMDRTKFYVMVYGYDAGSYDLSIRYTNP